MSNEVTRPTNNAMAAAMSLKKNLQIAANALPEASNAQFLRYLQDGNWVFGKENEEVLEEDRIALNPLSIQTGFSCWTDRPKGVKNELMGEVLVPLGQPAALRSDLPVRHDKQNDDKLCAWRDMASVQMRFLDGPHKGKQVQYSTTALGGVSAIKEVVNQLILQLDEDPANIVPVVSLSGSHYTHKAYGRTYTPTITILEFTSMDGDGGAPAETDEVEEKVEQPKKRTRKETPEKAPAKRTRKAAPEKGTEPEDEENDGVTYAAGRAAEVSDEAPVRRRRR